MGLGGRKQGFEQGGICCRLSGIGIKQDDGFTKQHYACSRLYFAFPPCYMCYRLFPYSQPKATSDLASNSRLASGQRMSVYILSLLINGDVLVVVILLMPSVIDVLFLQG